MEWYANAFPAAFRACFMIETHKVRQRGLQATDIRKEI